MAYAEQDSIEKDISFKTPSGLVVKTTGRTSNIEAHSMYVHEVVISEGTGEGFVFLHNLDKAQPL